MKAVGEPFEIALGIRLDQAKLVADDALQRRALAFGLADQQARKLVPAFSAGACAMPISTTSTPGTSCGCTRSGGSSDAAVGRRRRAFGQLEIGQAFPAPPAFRRAAS